MRKIRNRKWKIEKKLNISSGIGELHLWMHPLPTHLSPLSPSLSSPLAACFRQLQAGRNEVWGRLSPDIFSFSCCCCYYCCSCCRSLPLMFARYKIQNVSDKRQQRDGSAQCGAAWGAWWVKGAESGQFGNDSPLMDLPCTHTHKHA